MKKLIGLVVGMLMTGLVYAVDLPPQVVEGVMDRVNGEWAIECSGSRTDGAKPGQDWSISNNQMNYVGYGVLSHTLIDFLNNTYLEAGNQVFEQMGIPERLMIVK